MCGGRGKDRWNLQSRAVTALLSIRRDSSETPKPVIYRGSLSANCHLTGICQVSSRPGFLLRAGNLANEMRHRPCPPRHTQKVSSTHPARHRLEPPPRNTPEERVPPHAEGTPGAQPAEPGRGHTLGPSEECAHPQPHTYTLTHAHTRTPRPAAAGRAPAPEVGQPLAVFAQ